MTGRRALLLAVVGVAGTLLAVRLVRADGETRREPVTTASIVLLGDSLTEGGTWSDLLPGHPVSNHGYSGLTTEELVAKAEAVVGDQPAMVVIMTGTNDIRDGHPPSWTVRHLTRILDLIAGQSPGTEVVVQTVLPRSDAVAEVEAVNRAIGELASGRQVTTLDVHSEFDNGSGGLRAHETTDGLHLTEAGYTRWATILDAFLD